MPSIGVVMVEGGSPLIQAPESQPQAILTAQSGHLLWMARKSLGPHTQLEQGVWV